MSRHRTAPKPAAPFVFHHGRSMFVLLLVIAAVLVAAILYLPYASGLTTVSVQNNKRRRDAAHQPEPAEYSGYLPPDEAVASLSSKPESLRSRASAFRDRIQVTQEDMPLKIKLDHQDSLRRRNKVKLDINPDPNSYDYDIDELIQEEANEALQEQQRQTYRGEVLGQDKEAMV